jgi:hypothetical protein
MTELIQELIAQFAPVIEDWDVTRIKHIREDYVDSSIRVFDRKMTVSDVTSSSRQNNIVCMRHCLISVFFNNHRITLRELALGFGRTDHTTIISALNKVSDMLFIGDEQYARCMRLVQAHKCRVFHEDNPAYIAFIRELSKQKTVEAV